MDKEYQRRIFSSSDFRVFDVDGEFFAPIDEGGFRYF